MANLADFQTEWEEKIRRAKKVRENWKKQFKVELCKEFFEGRQNIYGYAEAEWITINKIYSHLKAQIPSLYPTDPYFYVKLKRSFSPNPMNIALWEQRGKIRAAMLNYLKGETKLKDNAKLAIQDAFFQYGVIKTKYQADLKKNPNYGEYVTEDETVLLGEDGAPMLEPEHIPVNERYEVMRIHPDDFLVDEDAGPLESSWKWIAQRVETTLDEAKNDKRFSKAAVNTISDASGSEDQENQDRKKRKKGDELGNTDPFSSNYNKKKPNKCIVYWEVYDIKEKRWFIIAEGAKLPLLKPDDYPPGIDEHCFSILRFTLRDDSFYPIPPLTQGLDPAKEYNMARSQVMTHRKRFNRKYLALDQAVEDTELSKLENGDDGTVIKAKVLDAVKPIQDAPLDQQRYIELNFLNNDMIELLGGASDESRGIAGADSATQASILDNRLEIRQSDEKSMVMDFVTNIARRLDMLVQANIDRETAIFVTGPQGEMWQLVRETDYEKIDGEYEYSVNVGATIPQLPQMERASFMAFLQVMAGFPHIMTRPRLMKRVMEMHHIEDEALVQELLQLGQQIVSGQMAPPGNPGSTAGVSEVRPRSAMAGQMSGLQSLNQPGAGNING